MAQIIDIDEDNVEEFEGYLDKDIAENIGRSFYRALAACDDDSTMPFGAMVWVLKHIEHDDEDNESEILWIRCDDEAVFPEMMDAYTRSIKEEGVVRSCASIPAQNGKEMKALLKQQGFQMKLTESDTIIVKLSELSEMPMMKKLKKTKVPDTIMPLNLLSLRTFRKGIAKCVDKGRFGLCEDLAELGLNWFEDEVSCASTVESGINGLFLFHKKPSGILAVQLMICLDKSAKTTIPLMMRQFVSAMEAKYGLDTLIELDRHNEQSLLLSEKLLPRGFGTPLYEGGREEQRD